MSFAEEFRRGRDQVRGARGGTPLPPSPRNTAPPRETGPPRASGPSPIKIGYYCPLEEDNPGQPLYSSTELAFLLFGLNGAGKSTRFLIELLMTASNRSLLIFDVKGELAVQTAAGRRRYGDVYFINPHRMHGLPSHGFNPLRLDPADDMHFSHLTDIGAAAIDFSEKDKHWDESAQSLLEGFCGWEILQAKRENRLPSFRHVRRMLCEPDEEEEYIDAKGRKQRRLLRGITYTTQRILDEGGAVLAGLVGRFVRKHGLNELASIQSTADTQSKWILDPMMAADLSKPGVDFRQFRMRPTTVYVMIHPLELRKNKRWTRLIISQALCAFMRPGPVKALCILDEFYASVGNLPIVNDVWSLVRGFGVQLMPILQSALQLQKLFDEEWENYVAQAGLVATLGPANDMFTAKWMSDRCGVTTALQASLSENDGFNIGDGTSSGTSGGGASTNQGNSQNSGHSRGAGINWQQAERQVLLPQEIRNIRAGHGLAWVPGMGTKTIPFFAPNYFRCRAPWVSEVRPNPYRTR